MKYASHEDDKHCNKEEEAEQRHQAASSRITHARPGGQSVHVVPFQAAAVLVILYQIRNALTQSSKHIHELVVNVNQNTHESV